MKAIRILLAVGALGATAAASAQVGVSVTVGQPGFYGHIDIGDMPQPRVIYPQPVIIQHGPAYPPMYLRVPPGHEKHWNKHCAEYNACGRPVYFVQNDWYENTYVPAYQKKHGAPPEVEGWQDWFGATAILTAIKETNSTDSAKLVAFLEEHKFDGYKDAPIGFRNFDHQLVQPLLVASVKDKISDKYDYFNIDSEYPKDLSQLDAAYGS